jgi:hypothetical protein
MAILTGLAPREVSEHINVAVTIADTNDTISYGNHNDPFLAFSTMYYIHTYIYRKVKTESY